VLVVLLGAACLGDVRRPGEPIEGSTGEPIEPSTSASASASSSVADPSTTASTDASSSTTSADSSSGDSSSTTDASRPELVEVGHAREFRGAWVVTVYNINFPSAAGLSAQEQQEELLDLLDVAAALRLNALVLQVRAESDALYASDLEPWSRYLGGTQGDDPGYDPLAFAVEEAHARGIELHAWINPFRAKVDVDAVTADNHISQTLSEYAYPYGTQMYMDPGAVEVRDQVVDVALDLADRYEIDGIQTDDYYYPYRNAGPFPDDATWQAYQSSGGMLSLEDWRRDNVNRLIETLHEELLAAAPHVRYGAAPFGIYRPGVPPGISGLDQYTALYADPLHWMQQGWVDFLAPQLYWATTQPQQAYDVLLEWWSSVALDGHPIFAGIAAYKVGVDPLYDVDEVLLQLELVRDLGPPAQGAVFYNIETLVDDTLGAATAIAESVYVRPALTPPLPRDDLPEVAPPIVTSTADGVELDHADLDSLRAFVVYADIAGELVVEQIVGAEVGFVPLSSGTWAVSAADRFGTESLGVVVERP
jgi:uncharacterized lipoprotein YddW (UPF0748 family)